MLQSAVSKYDLEPDIQYSFLGQGNNNKENAAEIRINDASQGIKMDSTSFSPVQDYVLKG